MSETTMQRDVRSDVRSLARPQQAGFNWQQRKTLVVRQSEGDVAWLANDHAQVKLGADLTGDAYLLAYNTVCPGGGPCAHRHANEDEAFYVIDGELDFTYGNKVCRARRGDFVWIPRGLVHAFHNPTEEPASFIVIVTPGSGFEAFARRCGQSWHGQSAPTGEALLRSIRMIMETAPHFGIAMLPKHATTGLGALPELAEPLNVFGNEVRLLCTGADSRQSLCVAEITCGSETAPPMHAHVNQSEAFYVVDGTLQLVTEEVATWLRPGDVAYVPAGVMHTFASTGGETRFISIHTPAGMELFFEEAATKVGQSSEIVPEEAMTSMLRRHGMTMGQ